MFEKLLNPHLSKKSITKKKDILPDGIVYDLKKSFIVVKEIYNQLKNENAFNKDSGINYLQLKNKLSTFAAQRGLSSGTEDTTVVEYNTKRFFERDDINIYMGSLMRTANLENECVNEQDLLYYAANRQKIFRFTIQIISNYLSLDNNFIQKKQIIDDTINLINELVKKDSKILNKTKPTSYEKNINKVLKDLFTLNRIEIEDDKIYLEYNDLVSPIAIFYSLFYYAIEHQEFVIKFDKMIELNLHNFWLINENILREKLNLLVQLKLITYESKAGLDQYSFIFQDFDQFYKTMDKLEEELC